MTERTTADRRQELGLFLVSRRARVKPSDVGLSEGRRRTVGLRREEVALLAGLSVSWYTWLEQGRDIRVSAAALTRISKVLQLSRAEVVHMFALACQLAPPEVCKTVTIGNVRLLIDALQPTPAYVRNSRWDVVAWNPACAELFTDYSLLAPHERNTLRLMFLYPPYRTLIVNWEALARGTMESFRVARSKALDRRPFDELADELFSSSAEFREWWPHHDVRILGEGVERLQHPKRGLLDVPYIMVVPEGRPDLTLVAFFPRPADASS